MIFRQVNVPERECRNLGFGKIVSPTCFEIEAWTHARVPYSFSGQMVVHYEEVELIKTLENIVKLERPSFSEIVARSLVGWHLYSFLTQIFLQLVVLEKEYRKRIRGMRFVDKMDMVDKEIENLTRRR